MAIREIILLAEDEAVANKNKNQFGTEFILAKRSVSSTILDHTEEQNINLIVVGTTGRSGIKKVLPGSVASGLVTYAICPVLVIK